MIKRNAKLYDITELLKKRPPLPETLPEKKAKVYNIPPFSYYEKLLKELKTK
jgi:hypothetical protein